MHSRLFGIVIGLLALLSAGAAHAQGTPQSKQSLSTEFNTLLPDQTTGAITPAGLRSVLNDMVASDQQYAGVNAQTGATYTVLTTDYGQLLTFNRGSAVAVTLPAASIVGFSPFSFFVENYGAGTVTITPVSGTINNGASNLQLSTGKGAFIASDGVNWQVAPFSSAGGGGGTPGGSNTQLQFNNAASFGGISGATTNGTAVTFANAALLLAGSGSGTTTLEASATASGVITFPATTDTVVTLGVTQTLTNKSLTSPVITGTVTGTATLSGALTFSGTDNFTGTLQVNGTTQTFPTSGNIVGAGDTQTLTNKSIAGSEINSGTVAATYLPTATSAALGVVQGDGSTLTITGGTIKCTTATTSQLGCVEPDGSTITISAGGVISSSGGSATAITIGTTTVTSGNTGRVLYQNGASPTGTIGEYTITGTAGSVVMSASPTLSGTIGGTLTFSGGVTLSGTLTAASLATPGSIAGSICASAAGAIFYDAGNNCFGGATPGGSPTYVQFNSAGNFGGAAGFTFDGTSVITLGVAGSSVGSVALNNATSGTITISPPTGALGTVTATVPANTGTIAELNLAQAWTAAQRGTPVNVSISTATFTPNFNTAQNFEIDLTSACPCTLANPSTTLVAGQSGVIEVHQDAGGSRTITTWGSKYQYAGGTATIVLSTGSNAVDYISYYVNNAATGIVLGTVLLAPAH